MDEPGTSSTTVLLSQHSRGCGGGWRGFSAEVLLDKGGHDMEKVQIRLLNPPGVAGGDDNRDVDLPGQGSPTRARESDSDDPLAPRRRRGFQDVLGAPARRQQDGDVSGR